MVSLCPNRHSSPVFSLIYQAINVTCHTSDIGTHQHYMSFLVCSSHLLWADGSHGPQKWAVQLRAEWSYPQPWPGHVWPCGSSLRPWTVWRQPPHLLWPWHDRGVCLLSFVCTCRGCTWSCIGQQETHYYFTTYVITIGVNPFTPSTCHCILFVLTLSLPALFTIFTAFRITALNLKQNHTEASKT